MKDALPLKASLQIKAAEYWLKMGEADQALRELEALPSRFWNHRWALKTRIAAMGILRERDEMTIQLKLKDHERKIGVLSAIQRRGRVDCFVGGCSFGLPGSTVTVLLPFAQTDSLRAIQLLP